MQHTVLEKDDGVVVANRVGQGAFRVQRGRRGHYLEARHVHEHAVQRLRVLCALTPATTDDSPHNERHALLAARHVHGLRRDIDDLVHGEHEEIHSDMYMNRTQAGHRHADACAGHAVLGKRRIHHAIGPEALRKTPCAAKDRLRIIDAQADHENAIVPLHLLVEGFANGLDLGQRTCLDHANTSSRRSVAAGNGLSSAYARAATSSASTAASRSARSRGSSISPSRLTWSFCTQGRASSGER